MSFQMPPGFFTAGATMGNALNTEKALREQTARLEALLAKGKDIPCPYCSQLIAKDALVCNQCQGALAIGKWPAIRAAILSDPALALRDPETFATLRAKVQEIEEFWTEQECLERDRKAAAAAAAAKAAADAKREQEAVAVEAKRKNAERIASMSPIRQFVLRHKQLGLVIVMILVVGSPFTAFQIAHAVKAANTARRCSSVIKSMDIGSDLRKCNLSRASLDYVDLSLANLSGANLSNTYLVDATLVGANLSGANLTNAHLARANLSNSDLTGATLTGAIFNEATLTGAVLNGVIWASTTCPDGTDSNDNGGTCVGHF